MIRQVDDILYIKKYHIEKLIFQVTQEGSISLTKTRNVYLDLSTDFCLRKKTSSHLGFNYDSEEKLSKALNRFKEEKYYRIGIDESIISNLSFYCLLTDHRSSSSNYALYTDNMARTLYTIPMKDISVNTNIIYGELVKGEMPYDIIKTLELFGDVK